MAVNSVVMSGRICSDLEVKNANNKNSSPYIRFSIAVPRDYKDEDGNYPTDFFYCLVFGQNAKFLGEYGYKGREVTLSGKLQQRKYENKKGEKSQIVEIKCESITLHGKPKSKDGDKKGKNNKKKG